MIEKIVNKIILRKEGESSAEELAVLKYGYTVMIEIFLIIIISVIIGVLTNSLVELLLFSLSFILLRTFGGGYHARTAKGCVLISAIITIVFCTTVNTLKRFYTVILVCTILIFLITMVGYTPKSATSNETIEKRCLVIIKITFPIITLLSVGASFLFADTSYGISILLGGMFWLLSVNIERIKCFMRLRKVM